MRYRYRATMAVLAMALSAAGSATAQPQETTGLRVRKNVLELTAQERKDYVDAIFQLKAAPSPFDPKCWDDDASTSCLNYYEQFSYWHAIVTYCDRNDPASLGDHMYGHAGPMFLPWHRQFLLLFENGLRVVSGKDITVPYWDWTDRRSIASVFADDFMGGNGDPSRNHAVVRGPFTPETWRFQVFIGRHRDRLNNFDYLRRKLGVPGALPPPQEVEDALQAPYYDVEPYDEAADPYLSFRNHLEGFGHRPVSHTTHGCLPDETEDGKESRFPWPTGMLHNQVHNWVGGSQPGVGPNGISWPGTMSALHMSTNDPVFYLHHSNIDRIWAEWQQTHGIHTYRPESGRPQNDAGSAMRPYDEAGMTVTPRDVADIAQLGYAYSDAPIAGGVSSDAPFDGRATAGGPSLENGTIESRTFVCELRVRGREVQ